MTTIKLSLLFTVAFISSASADIVQQAYLKASNPDASDDFGQAVAIYGDTLVIGAPQEDSTTTGGQSNNGAQDAGAVYVFVRENGAWVQQAFLKAGNAGAGDQFGTAVAIHGDTLVVGAREEDSNSTTISSGTGSTNNSAMEAGAAYVFVRNGSSWTQQAYLKASNTGAGDQFGYSVAVSGNTAIIGARYEDGGGTDSGAAYVFTRSGTAWTQQALLRASNDGAGDAFGVSVDIEGETVIVGAHQEDHLGTDAGAAYVFTRSGSTWTQQQILRATGGGAEDAFGAEVGISGDSVVIRAALEDGNTTTVNGPVNNSASAAGAAYVFTRTGTTWSQQAYLKPLNAGAGDQFGRSVDIEGDLVVVGAPIESSNATGINGDASNNSAAGAGAAYVFTRSGTNWSQTAYLKASNTDAGDNFGTTNTVRISGSQVVVGAPLEDSNASGIDGNESLNGLGNSGAAYLFDLNASPLAPVFTSASDKGWSAFDPTLTTRTFAGATLGFAPAPGTTLMLVEKRGLGFLSGTFSNLSRGQKVTLNYNGQNYNFIANYYGGNGNDLVLQWRGSGIQIWGDYSHDPDDYRLPFKKVVGGSNHLVLLTGSGKMIASGSASGGVIPSGLTDVIDVSAGSWGHTIALQESGIVTAWGTNADGQASVPAGLTNVISVAAGVRHSMALKIDGSVVAWGLDNSNQASVPAGLSDVIAIAAGYHHSVALKSDGSVEAWGSSSAGRIAVPEGLSGVIAIAAGEHHSLALKSDGTVVAWGFNGEGQTTVPADLDGVVAIAAGESHSLALKGDGTLVAWGGNEEGQCNIPSGLDGVAIIGAGGGGSIAINDSAIVPFGDFNRFDRFVPLDLNNTISIAIGDEHSVALKENGTVVAWGLNENGQTSVPPGLGTVVAVSADRDHTVALKSDGTVVAWGGDFSGETVVPPGLNTVVAVSTCSEHTVALRRDGTLVGWGLDTNGQSSLPFSGLEDVVAIAVGPGHTVALSATNTVRAVGYNYYGQTTVPAGLAGVASVAARGYFTAALRSDGTVIAWGDNGHGQTSVPAGLIGVTAIAAGGDHMVALRADGEVESWGRNHVGQSSVPIELGHASAVAAGYSSTGAIKALEPAIRSVSAGSTSISTAVLIGKVVPHGQTTKAFFDYGPTTAYGSTASVILNDPAALSPQAISTSLTGLTPGTTYHYRLVATSVVGTTISADSTFTTPLPPSLDPEWSSVSSVPVTAAGYTATGTNFGIPVLSFAPAPGTTLTVVKNTALGFISGQFSDLEQGQKVPLTYNGVTYNFTANYHGGTGNDLVLQWAGLAPRTWGDRSFYPQDHVPPFTAVAAGLSHTVALKIDGTVVAWGSNSVGQTAAPSGLSGVVSIAASGGHSVALKGDGTVVAWGWNAFDQTTVPAGLTGVVSIAAGSGHTVALKSDGTVVAWGANGSGQTSVPAELDGVIAIAAGASHTVALKSNGTVVGWGRLNEGQITAPAGLDGVVAIAAGSNHTVALKNDGTVVAFGTSFGNPTAVPEGLSGVQAIATGESHILALKTDGTVVAWGYDEDGQTVVPDGLSGVTAIAAGGYHSAAVKSDGTVVTWGGNFSGQTGVSPSGLNSVTNIATGWFHQAALTTGGTVVAWGRNIEGQTTVPASSSGAVAIAAGGYHTVALMDDGTVVAWGRNSEGQTTVPVGLGDVTAIAAGGFHTAALKEDGTVVAWGSDSSGQATVPAGLSDVVALSAGWIHTLALKSDGTVVAWGSNGDGQSMVPVGLTGVTSVAAGRHHSVALINDGTLVAWGLDDNGQATVPADLVGVTGIAAGDLHTVALKGDGSVVAWGYNLEGQTTVPSDLNGVATISAGALYTASLVPLKPQLTLPTTSIIATSATIQCSVNPNGQPTTVVMEYGLTNAYGNSTTVILADPSALTPQVAEATLTNLLPGTTYFYRLLATSVVGTTISAEASFTTLGPAIAVFGGTDFPENALSNNQTTPVDFGSHPAPTIGGVTRLFRVKNTGTAPLTIFSLGTNSIGAFELTSPTTPSEIAPGALFDFSVRFSTNTHGNFTGNVSILSDSPDHPSFTFPITATGLDVTPPSVQVSIFGGTTPPGFPFGPNYAKAGSMISLYITSSEPIAEPIVQICGKSAVVWESFGATSWVAGVTVDETFPQGYASVSVAATDLAGNTIAVTSPSSGTPVVVDTIAPTILYSSMWSSNPTTGWANAGDTVSISIYLSEQIVTPSLTVFGAPWMGTLSNNISGVWMMTEPITNEPEGPVAVSLQCSDLAGNVASFNVISFDPPVVVDRTPPLITQGAIKVEATSPGGATAIFTPTATDALGAIASVSSNPASGTFFPLGSTPVSVNATDSAGNTATGSFNLTVLEAGDFWRDRYFNQTTNSGDAADGADPDQDGLVNLIERAFNLHPLQAGNEVLISGTGTSGLPFVTPLGDGATKRLRIEYLRRKATSLAGIQYEAQFSTTLDPGWTPAASESVSSIDDLWERVVVEDSPGAPQSFGRVKVTTP